MKDYRIEKYFKVAVIWLVFMILFQKLALFFTETLNFTFSPNPLIDVGILGLCIVILAWFFSKAIIDYNLAKFDIINYSVLVVFYTYLRFFDFEITSFTSFSFTEKIYYLDILYFPTLAYLIAYYLIKPWYSMDRCKSSKCENGISLIVDEPKEVINENSNNLFQLENLYKILLKTTGKSSIAYSITGEWGSGKTSFINGLKGKLNLNKDFIVIDFNPWLNSDSERLISEFFNVISSELSKHRSSLHRDFMVYKELLLSSDNHSWISKTLNQFVGSSTIKDKFEDLKEDIREIDKKVVIIIDDIDRLEKKEISTVIKLIRNFADFPDFNFICAFDRSYVKNAIKNQINDYEYQTYLEKIFLHEVKLINYENEEIQNELKSNLIENLNNYEKEIQAFFNNSPYIITLVLKNYRDVKRFANQFILNLQKIDVEIFFDDFITMELLNFKYSEIHKTIYNKESEFFTEISKKEGYNPLGYKMLKTDEDNRTTILNKFLLQSKERLQLSLEEIEVIDRCLNELFEKDTQEPKSFFPESKIENNLSIVFENNFYKYFKLYVSPKELSEFEFRNIIKRDYEFIKEEIILLEKQMKIRQFFEKFKNLKITNRIEFEKTIKVLFFLGNFQKTISADNVNYLLNVWKLNSIDKLILTYYEENDELKDFIKTIHKKIDEYNVLTP